MKTKLIIAALLAGVMAATCIAGCTGNGNGDGEKEEQEQASFEKGEEVTAEEWTAAINASTNLSYSAHYLYNQTTSVTGNYMGNDKIPINLVAGTNYDSYQHLDLSSDNFWGQNLSTKYWVRGLADLNSHKADGTEDWWTSLEEFIAYNFHYSEDKEESGTAIGIGVKIDGKSYGGYGMLGAVPLSLNEEEKDEEFEWIMSDVIAMEAIDTLSNILMCATEENGEKKPLSDLYEYFTYSDGVYTADLWFNWAMATLSVSIKDGYVLSVAYKSTDGSYVREQDGLTVTYSYEDNILFYNIGKTTVKPAPEAVKAVQDYIKENS